MGTASVLDPVLDWLKEHPSPKARLPVNLQVILNSAEELSEFETISEKLYALKNGLKSRPTCSVCGGWVAFVGRFLRTCSIQCAGRDDLRRAAIEETSLKRYGVKTPAASKEAISKRMKTNRERYGVPVASQSPRVQEKIKKTNLERYGTSCSLHSPEIVKQKKETWLSNYGVDNPGKAEELMRQAQEKKRAKVNRKKQESLQQLQKHGIDPLFTEWEGSDKSYKWRHAECGTEFLFPFIGEVVPRCPVCFPRSISMEEQKIQQLLKELGVRFTSNDRAAISPLELDIFIPEKKLAIEVNGAYWHHDRGSARPLIEKTKQAAAAGIQLLHFWDHEVNENFDAVSSIIKSKLGLLQRRFARKLKVSDIKSMEAAEFLKRWHLAGFARAKIHLALVGEAGIEAVASFSPNRFKEDGSWELVRFASRGTVVGGLSRLIKEFRARETGPLVSFADARYSTGSAYRKLGFRLEGLTKPNYFYIKGGVRLHRQQAMKHKLPHLLANFDPNLSEYQNMVLNGWLRCFDCGSYKFILEGNLKIDTGAAHG